MCKECTNKGISPRNCFASGENVKFGVAQLKCRLACFRVRYRGIDHFLKMGFSFSLIFKFFFSDSWVSFLKLFQSELTWRRGAIKSRSAGSKYLGLSKKNFFGVLERGSISFTLIFVYVRIISSVKIPLIISERNEKWLRIQRRNLWRRLNIFIV